MIFKLYEFIIGYVLSAEIVLSYWSLWIEGSVTAAQSSAVWSGPLYTFTPAPAALPLTGAGTVASWPPGVCCLVPQVPDSQSISTNEGYLIYSDTPGQDWSTLNNLRTLCDILILFCSICLMIESKIGSFIWVLVLFHIWFYEYDNFYV